ncbi:MAG: inositol monophosphatase family protein [Planctomycetota bacterium]
MPAEHAEAIAREAGELLLGRFGTLSRADADRKSTHRDLVSKADVEAERHIIGRIPDGDDILAEEGSNRDTGARRKWVVDPLDGTVNFLHGIPVWCVSIGVLELGELVAGVVHAPALDLTWTAERGGGCFLNGKRVSVSSTADIGESIVATGFAYRRDLIPDNNFDNFSEVGMRAAGVRRMGAAAVDLAFVASGTLDAFWELHLNAWDMAAGILLIREAGGKVTDFGGSGEIDKLLFGRNLVASNGKVHDQLRGLLMKPQGL